MKRRNQIIRILEDAFKVLGGNVVSADARNRMNAFDLVELWAFIEHSIYLSSSPLKKLASF